jgi:hypothetical protein
MAATASGFEAHRTGFRKHHASTLNVVLHLGLTPLGLLAAAAALARATSPEVASGAAAAYAASLALAVPFPLFVASAAATAGLAALAASLALSYGACAALLAASYFGQDAAHWLTGESTYQSSYAAQQGFWALLAGHTYYLLPLALDAAHAVGLASGVLLWLTPRNDVLFTKLVGADAKAALNNMREWVVAQAPSETCTTHWWANELPTPQRAAFESVAEGPEMKGMFFERFAASQYACESLPGMNEVYVASLVHANNSDTVFFMDHVDGPYMLYPFCYVYRTLVAITTNTQISTVFPMQPFKVAISDGEVIGLDFHREVHRIENDATKPNTERRITCKVRTPRSARPPSPSARAPCRALTTRACALALDPPPCPQMHYVVYPKCLGPVGRHLGALTVKYNQRFRYLFVNTISANSFFWQLMTKAVLWGTEGTFRMEQLLGLNNVAFLAALAAVGALAGAPLFFLAATSFLHHAKAIAAFHHRHKASIGKLQRDSIVMKVRAATRRRAARAHPFATRARAHPSRAPRPRAPGAADGCVCPAGRALLCARRRLADRLARPRRRRPRPLDRGALPARPHAHLLWLRDGTGRAQARRRLPVQRAAAPDGARLARRARRRPAPAGRARARAVVGPDARRADAAAPRAGGPRHPRLSREPGPDARRARGARTPTL